MTPAFILAVIIGSIVSAVVVLIALAGRHARWHDRRHGDDQ